MRERGGMREGGISEGAIRKGGRERGRNKCGKEGKMRGRERDIERENE